MYKPKGGQSSDSWKEDTHQWRIISSLHLPRRNPTILKRVYALLSNDGKVNKELKKEVYSKESGQNDLTLLHFLGNFQYEGNKLKVNSCMN